MNPITCDGILFAEMIKCGGEKLRLNRKKINDLNVFPVPDGDTGDNMLSTITSGIEKLDRLNSASISEASNALASGMLLGARGNSGVILSRIFAGIAKGFAGLDSASAADFAKAMKSGSREAYCSVSHPVEGTILTVIREGSNAADNHTENLKDYFSALVGELSESVRKTPMLLEDLANAGVVDSGGAGLLLISEGMNDALNGNTAEFSYESKAEAPADYSLFTSDSILEFGYCTEILLRLMNKKTDIASFDVSVIKDYLEHVGSSVVCFRDGSIVKLHVHTENPGEVLTFCRQYGEFLNVKIENMSLQHSEAADEQLFVRANVRKPFAIVACVNGDGLKKTFTEIGANVVIDGGQCMNPSVGDFISAFDEANADIVYVLPNNGNIIMTAGQAGKIYERSRVVVIASKTIGDGLAAMGCDFSLPENGVVSETAKLISASVTGEVAKASRNAELNGIDICKNDFIGYSGGKVLADSRSAPECVCALADSLGADDHDVIILICGQNADQNDTEKIVSELKNKYRFAEIIKIEGNQPIEDYILVLN